MRFIALALIFCSCATLFGENPNNDPRLKELQTIRAERTFADSAMAAIYTREARRTLDQVKQAHGTLADYNTKMEQLNALEVSFTSNIRAIDAAIILAEKQILAGVQGDVVAPVRKLVQIAMSVVTNFGLSLVTK